MISHVLTLKISTSLMYHQSKKSFNKNIILEEINLLEMKNNKASFLRVLVLLRVCRFRPSSSFFEIDVYNKIYKIRLGYLLIYLLAHSTYN
jgi:hypothetical protein